MISSYKGFRPQSSEPLRSISENTNGRISIPLSGEVHCRYIISDIMFSICSLSEFRCLLPSDGMGAAPKPPIFLWNVAVSTTCADANR